MGDRFEGQARVAREAAEAGIARARMWLEEASRCLAAGESIETELRGALAAVQTATVRAAQAEAYSAAQGLAVDDEAAAKAERAAAETADVPRSPGLYAWVGPAVLRRGGE